MHEYFISINPIITTLYYIQDSKHTIALLIPSPAPNIIKPTTRATINEKIKAIVVIILLVVNIQSHQPFIIS